MSQRGDETAPWRHRLADATGDGVTATPIVNPDTRFDIELVRE